MLNIEIISWCINVTDVLTFAVFKDKVSINNKTKLRPNYINYTTSPYIAFTKQIKI